MTRTQETMNDSAVVRTAPRIVLTVEEAAEALGIGRTLMYELIGSGAVESVTIGRLRRVPADALDAFVDQLRSGVGDRASVS